MSVNFSPPVGNQHDVDVCPNFTLDDLDEDVLTSPSSPGFEPCSEDCFTMLVRVQYKLHLRAREPFFKENLQIYYSNHDDLVGEALTVLFFQHFLNQVKIQELFLYPASLKLVISNNGGKHTYEEISAHRALLYHKSALAKPDLPGFQVFITVSVSQNVFKAKLLADTRQQNQRLTADDLKDIHKNYKARDGYWDMWADLVNKKKATSSVVPIDLLRFLKYKLLRLLIHYESTSRKLLQKRQDM
ncbi:hypothetical protein GEMRC1_005209 [Eukaryota sp. GEM-RC1]